MLFGEILAVCSENHTKRLHPHCISIIQEFLNFEVGDTYVTVLFMFRRDDSTGPGHYFSTYLPGFTALRLR